MRNDSLQLPQSLEFVVFVAGPSGSGKTTLVRRLRPLGEIYEERGEENPFLERHLAGGELDASANQIWFLDRIRGFLTNVKHRGAIVDQHPWGVDAYTRLFAKSGLIATVDARALRDRAATIVEALSLARVRTLTVVLSARTETLWARLSARTPGPRLDRETIAGVNEMFQGIVFHGDCMPINTDVVGPEAEAELVARWVDLTPQAG